MKHNLKAYPKTLKQADALAVLAVKGKMSQEDYMTLAMATIHLDMNRDAEKNVKAIQDLATKYKVK